MMKKNLSIADLDIVAVNTHSPLPLYHQIEADLRRMIASGIISPSDILPPELELSRAYGVGRHTMREALSRLVADNIITRRAGMGTVVNTAPDRTQFYLDRSFSRQMAQMGRAARSQVLDSALHTITHDHPSALHGHLGEPCFYLQRLRFGDDEPIGIQSAYILRRYCEGIEAEDFHDTSLYDVLATKYQVVITRIDHVVTAESASDLQAELLSMQSGAALLRVNTRTYIQGQQLIEFTQSYYRADRYEYNTSSSYDSQGY